MFKFALLKIKSAFFMKFTRLTKEQFVELHQEFINFLATQSITAKEWKEIKTQNPEVAEQELDIFSDLVWEGVLQKAKYLENISTQHIYLFYLGKRQIECIGLKVNNPKIDLTTKEGYSWLQGNLLSDDVELFNANKSYSEDPQMDKFSLIKQGAVITKGALFKYFEKLIG
jgi:cag pathogenicity island protein 24